MKYLSKQYRYDDAFFAGKIPETAARVRPPSDEDLPVFVKHDFLSAGDCRRIAEQFLAAGPNDRPGARAEAAGALRKAFSFELTGEAKRLYTEALASVRPEVEAFFGAALGDSAGAHGLGYTPGCKYDLHADNCDPEFDASGALQGFRHVMPERHISSLLFLTDSVEELNGDYQHVGGNLSFRFLLDEQGEMLLIEPRQGLFVAFPSDPVFSHEVHEVYEVSTGFRLAIVDWHACEPDDRGKN
jgi:predicted 2-oxoglutarate/Fe(II)-dependent dioxygenase YbiX